MEGLFVLVSIKNALTMACYTDDPTAPAKEVLNQEQKIELVEKKLGDGEWLEGEEATVCDLLLMEVVDQFQMITKGEWVKDHPVLKIHSERTKAIPNIKAYKESDRYFEGPSLGLRPWSTMCLLTTGTSQINETSIRLVIDY